LVKKQQNFLANNQCLLFTALGVTIMSALFSFTQDWLSTLGHLLRPNTGQKSHKKGLSKAGYVW
jgi:hypothetical protein